MSPLTIARLLALTSLAACRGGGGPPAVAPGAAAPVVASATDINAIEVQEVLIDTPTAVPIAPDPAAELPPLQRQRTTIGLVLTSRFQCADIARALELREYEGSILGSHGIDVAVTYFVPILHQERCQAGDGSHEYRVAVAWERRTDTEWTIVVPGYRGAVDRVPGTALFAGRVTGHQASPATRAALAAMPSIGVHPATSMTNAGRIQSVKTDRDAATGDVIVSVTVNYGNECEAETPWRLTPVSWSPDASGTAHVWATLEPPPDRKECPDILQVSPEPIATSRLRIAAPSGARSLAISIPNVARRSGIPVHTETLALP